MTMHDVFLPRLKNPGGEISGILTDYFPQSGIVVLYFKEHFVLV